MDPVVPPAESRALVAALVAAGGSPRLTEYPDLGHLCWDRAYADPAVLAWWQGGARSPSSHPKVRRGLI
jgi:acetyl esterase/lipase